MKQAFKRLSYLIVPLLLLLLGMLSCSKVILLTPLSGQLLTPGNGTPSTELIVAAATVPPIPFPTANAESPIPFPTVISESQASIPQASALPSQNLVLTLLPTQVQLNQTGEQAQLIAQVRDGAGNILNISGSDIEWTSSQPQDIAVDQNGLVTALTSSFADITAFLKNTPSVRATVKVTVGTSGNSVISNDSSNADAGDTPPPVPIPTPTPDPNKIIGQIGNG